MGHPAMFLMFGYYPHAIVVVFASIYVPPGSPLLTWSCRVCHWVREGGGLRGLYVLFVAFVLCSDLRSAYGCGCSCTAHKWTFYFLGVSQVHSMTP